MQDTRNGSAATQTRTAFWLKFYTNAGLFRSYGQTSHRLLWCGIFCSWRLLRPFTGSHYVQWGETMNHVFGRTLNPYNLAFTPGGSSGGEGALVAMKGSPLGVGTDIGGSVHFIYFLFVSLWK